MKRLWVPEHFAIDPVGTAGALAALAGLASVGWPFFEGMTAALSALAIVGWAIGSKEGGAGWRRPVAIAGVLTAFVGWGFFLFASGPGGVYRGAVLGASAGWVGWIGRRSPAFGGGP